MAPQAALAVAGNFGGRQEGGEGKPGMGKTGFAEETKNQVYASNVTSKHGSTVF